MMLRDPLTALRRAAGTMPSALTRGLTGATLWLTLAQMPAEAADPPEAPRVWQMTWSTAGRLTGTRDPAGATRAFRFDGSGQLSGEERSDGVVIVREPGRSGSATRSDGIGTWRIERDAMERITGVTPPSGPVQHYDYDGAGRLRRIGLSDGWFLKYDYDLFDRPTRVESPIGVVVFAYALDHRADGQPRPQVTRRLPNGVTTIWTYDTDGLLRRLRHERSGSILADWSYRTDGLSRLVSVTDTLSGIETRFLYDNAGHLARINRDGLDEEIFAYDGSGRLDTMIHNGVTRRLRFDGFGQIASDNLATFRRDAAGRLTARDEAATRWRYGYDGAGSLISAADGARRVTYGYDADGTLATRTDSAGTLILVRDMRRPHGDILGTYRGDHAMSHVLLAGRPVAERLATGETRFFLEDATGTPYLVTDADGAIVSWIGHSGFGELSVAGEARGPLMQGWSGGLADSVTGLQQLDGRWYDPAHGRFLTPEAWRGDQPLTGALDRYLVANGDPINRGRPPRTAFPIDLVRTGSLDLRTMIERRIFDMFRGLSPGSIEIGDEPLNPARWAGPHAKPPTRRHEAGFDPDQNRPANLLWSGSLATHALNGALAASPIAGRLVRLAPPRPETQPDDAPLRIGVPFMPQATRAMMRFRELAGLSIDRARGRLILFGDSSDDATSGVGADELAVALLAARRGQFPGVSLEPDDGDPRASGQRFYYFGPTANTRFGTVMAQSDRQMKIIGLGVDNENTAVTVRPAIEGFKDQFELADVWGSNEAASAALFELSPARIVWQRDGDGTTFWCQDIRMSVRTQAFEARNGVRIGSPGLHLPSNETFATWMTDHYDALSAIYPVFADLRELTKLTSIAAELAKTLPQDEYDRLLAVLRPYSVPSSGATPSVRITRKLGGRTIQAQGGVNLTPPDGPSPEAGPAADAARAAINAEPVGNGAVMRSVRLGGRDYRMVILPLASFASPGGLEVRERDLDSALGGLLIRTWSGGGDQDTGLFGSGWRLSRPMLDLPRDGSQPKVPAALLAVLGLAAPPTFTAIENDYLKGMEVRGARGETWRIGYDGRIMAVAGPTASLSFEEENGRLVAVRRQRQGEPEALVRLSYDGDRVTIIDEGMGGPVHYRYDAAGRLTEVESRGKLIRYSYDSADQLSSRSVNGVAETFQLGTDGDPRRIADPDGVFMTYSIGATADGGVRLETGGVWNGTTLFDATGQINGVAGPNWAMSDARNGDSLTRQMRVGAVTAWRDTRDVSGAAARREIAGDRVIALVARDGAATAHVSDPATGEPLDMRFDRDGRWTNLETSAGTFQRIPGDQTRPEIFVTPWGTWRFQADAAMGVIRIDGPDGERTIIERDANGKIVRVAETARAGEFEWQRSGASWELRNAGRVLRALSLDADAQVERVVAGSAVTETRYGPGGAVTRTPDGRHIITRIDSERRVTEIEEYPANAAAPELPVADVTSKTQFEELLAPKDEDRWRKK